MQVAAGSVQKAVIVETKKEFGRADGSTLRFDRNACVLVNDKGDADLDSCCISCLLHLLIYHTPSGRSWHAGIGIEVDVYLGRPGQPIGTRVLGFVTHELRSRNLVKVLSLASRVL